MYILKFGGTSVKDAAAIKQVYSIINQTEQNSLVVVSAFATVTNTIVKIISGIKNQTISNVQEDLNNLKKLHINNANELNAEQDVIDYINKEFARFEMLIEATTIISEVSPKTEDIFLSFGERLSSFIIAKCAKFFGVDAAFINSSEIIITDEQHTAAEVDFELTEQKAQSIIFPLLKKNKAIICGGFIGGTSSGAITTLSRGGSDYSAAILASVLNADRLDIFTDVDGIMTCDPNKVPYARLIDRMSYSEAAELAFFGAKVLHPKTIFPAVSKNIPVRVRNTFNYGCLGTEILGIKANQSNIKAIAFRSGITVINISSNRMLGAYGFLSKVFEIFGRYKTSVDIVATSEVSVSLTIDSDNNLQKIISELKHFASIETLSGKAMVSIIGEGLRDTAGFAAKFFGVLSDINILMVSFGASEINLSIVIDSDNLQDAISKIHNEFF